ncbi:FAD-dependent oxidoreductase [bacterium]|nr:FAD-dependent oxidoreductase [bacterium]
MKVIIIGAVAAGSKAAAKLKRLRPDCDVIIYTADNNVSYSECGLPYYIAGAFKDVKKLIIRTPQEFEKQGVTVHIKHFVKEIYPDKKEIVIKNLETETIFTENYDKLIISTGASPYLPEIEGINLQNVFTLRTIEDGIAIKNAVLQNKKAVILGGGYIGIELLEALVKQGLSVNVIQSSEVIMSVFDKDLAEIIQKYVIQKNLEQVKIINNDTITKIDGNNSVEKIITEKGKEIETDMVILSAGIRPNVQPAASAGIELGETGAIKVNSRMETNIKDIYACGDCVEKHHIVAERPCWLPLGSTANKEGRCCAINVSGGQDEFEGVLGSAVTKYFDFTMSMTGLTENQAIKYGFEPVSVVVRKNDKAGYMPDVESITIKLTADKNTRRILGAQGLGQGDVDKRINTLTGALLAKMTIQEFFGNDITYSPPFSTSIDPMLTAAQNLMSKFK